MKSFFPIGLLCTIALLSCDQTSEQNPSTHIPGLHLNKGQKWAVNHDTHGTMLRMKEMISTFKASKKDYYDKLGVILAEQLNHVIKNCDMTGKQYKQLYLVLTLIRDQVDAIIKSSVIGGGPEAVDEMREILRSYFTYFEPKEE